VTTLQVGVRSHTKDPPPALWSPLPAASLRDPFPQRLVVVLDLAIQAPHQLFFLLRDRAPLRSGTRQLVLVAFEPLHHGPIGVEAELLRRQKEVLELARYVEAVRGADSRASRIRWTPTESTG